MFGSDPAGPAPMRPTPGLGRPRPVILIIEDEALLAMELDALLSEAGHDVVLAATSAAALAQAADPALQVRAAIVNLSLPGGISGQDTVRRLRAMLPGLPVLVVTGYAPSASQADLRGTGGPTVRLHKPIDPERLLQRLQDAIGSISGVA